MTRECAKQVGPIIAAFGDGKAVQIKHYGADNWLDMNESSTWAQDAEYRIKPEPKRFWLRVCGVSDHNLIIEDGGKAPMHRCHHCKVVHVQETPATK